MSPLVELNRRRNPRLADGTGRSRRIVLVVMCVGYFLVLLDVTIVNIALPRIGSRLHAGTSGLQWVVDGYAIALAALMLAGGTIGDLHGHKRIVLTGFVVFGAASLGCGLSPTTGLLVGFRVLQGVGAALMLPGTLAVISNAYPGSEEQARAIGIWAAIGSAALPAGPHATVLVAIVAAVVLTVTFVWVERSRAHPMLPLSLFRRAASQPRTRSRAR
jgi:MFS transporter, DHA2 family, methylenomycin A resistance protein